MPLSRPGRALVVALSLLTVTGPASAGGDPSAGAYPRHVRTRLPPPEVRARDTRFARPPTGLIVGYLPRYTEAPMYNEPPSRFPNR